MLPWMLKYYKFFDMSPNRNLKYFRVKYFRAPGNKKIALRCRNFLFFSTRSNKVYLIYNLPLNMIIVNTQHNSRIANYALFRRDCPLLFSRRNIAVDEVLLTGICAFRSHENITCVNFADIYTYHQFHRILHSKK